jgi:hypothetical protein
LYISVLVLYVKRFSSQHHNDGVVKFLAVVLVVILSWLMAHEELWSIDVLITLYLYCSTYSTPSLFRLRGTKAIVCSSALFKGEMEYHYREMEYQLKGLLRIPVFVFYGVSIMLYAQSHGVDNTSPTNSLTPSRFKTDALFHPASEKIPVCKLACQFLYSTMVAGLFFLRELISM